MRLLLCLSSRATTCGESRNPIYAVLEGCLRLRSNTTWYRYSFIKSYVTVAETGRAGTDAQAYRREGASNTTIEGTFEEIERLEVQHEKALVQLRETEHELEELNDRRIELAPAAFTGDKVADKNFMILEGEAGRLTRRARLARNTAKELERRLVGARKRRTEERGRFARERFRGVSGGAIRAGHRSRGNNKCT